MDCLTSCLLTPEEETEWRKVPLRFTKSTQPAEGQLGSTNNSIKTSKYTIWTWIPKGTFEQFRRLANVYFLGISVLMIIGTYTTLYENSIQYYTTLGPLVVIIGFTLVKEGLEDKKRHESDNEVNTREAEVLVLGEAGGAATVKWRDLQPGMVVVVRDRGEFPADVVCLASSDHEGKCYIETANIDGETNLKLRKCAACDEQGIGPGWASPDHLLASVDGSRSPLSSPSRGLAPGLEEDVVILKFEPPNPSIHTFGGLVTRQKKGVAALPDDEVQGAEAQGAAASRLGARAACGAQELCLRGAVLRNTKWVLGAVVYTGADTKLVMNSRSAPSKMSSIEVTVNRMIYFILGADLLLTSAATLGHALWQRLYLRDMWYLCAGPLERMSPVFQQGCDRDAAAAYGPVSYWPTFFILFNNFLPLSLYVTLEVVNFVMASFVDQDIEMYHEETNTPALARTSNQNGDLGQIEYIFSDKTGTLTCNEMKFRRCSVGGSVYGNVGPVPLAGAQGAQGRLFSGGSPGRPTPQSGGSETLLPPRLARSEQKAGGMGGGGGSSGEGGEGGGASFVSPKSSLEDTSLFDPLDPTPPPSPPASPEEKPVEQTTLVGQPLTALAKLATASSSVRTVAMPPPPPALSSGAAGAAGGGGYGAAQRVAELLAVCHTVVVEKDAQGQGGAGGGGGLVYQAESPDEEALVAGAQELGYTFLGATSTELTVGHGGGGVRKYKILATIPFSSSRKRMSVLVETPEGLQRLYTKGADNVMFDLAGDFAECGGQALLDAHLESFSNEGLRTLVLAYRDLPADAAQEWLAKWNHALTLPDRVEACAAAAAEMELGLSILGATAIEDRLQDGVPETIADLKDAGIKVWVLTGDKMTTAINIGFSCRLLDASMEIITLDKEPPNLTPEDEGYKPPVASRLKAAFEKYSALVNKPDPAASSRAASSRGCKPRQPSRPSRERPPSSPKDMAGGLPASPPTSPPASSSAASSSAASSAASELHDLDTDHLGLVVDGPSLVDLLGDEASRKRLLGLGCFCKAVIACRVSPAQKQLIVKMVKEGLPHRPVTLSIGDGANDVPMIQEAQIGVGISGKEGRQAVNSSDFAIAQFRYLKRLLLVHGRYNYRRISKVIIYSFYKNIVLVMVLFLYSCYSGFSGQSLYGASSWCYSGYNFFLGLPPFMLGFFDRDVKPRTAMNFHKLYYVGLKNLDLSVAKMAEGFLLAIGDACLLFFLTMQGFKGDAWQAEGEMSGLAVFGNVVFCYLVTAMLLKICLDFSSWNFWSAFSIAFSACFYVGFVFAYSAVGPYSPYMNVGEYQFYHIPQHMFGLPAFFLGLLLIPTTSFLIHFTIKAVRVEFSAPREVVAAEYEAKMRYLSPEEKEIITQELNKRAEPGRTKSVVSKSEMDSLHQELDAPTRLSMGHVGASPGAFGRHRSSFVDNSAADHSYFGGKAPQSGSAAPYGGLVGGLGGRVDACDADRSEQLAMRRPLGAAELLDAPASGGQGRAGD